MSDLEEKIVDSESSETNELKKIYSYNLRNYPSRFEEIIDLGLLNPDHQLATT